LPGMNCLHAGACGSFFESAYAGARSSEQLDPVVMAGSPAAHWIFAQPALMALQVKEAVRFWLPGNFTGAFADDLSGAGFAGFVAEGLPASEHWMWLWWVAILTVVAVAVCALLQLVIWLLKAAASRVIRLAVEAWDVDILGVDVRVGEISLNVFNGVVDVSHVVLQNPPGFSSDFLLKASRIVIDVDMVSLLMGRKHIHVEKVLLKDVEIMYERRLTCSNISYVVDFIGAGKPAPAAAAKSSGGAAESAPEARQSRPARASAKAQEQQQQQQQQEQEHSRAVKLHQVEVKDAAVTLVQNVVGCPCALRIAMADFFEKDIAQDHVSVQQIVTLVVATILKSAIAAVGGRRFANRLL